MIGLSNAFECQIGVPGLFVTVLPGVVCNSGVVTNIPQTKVTLVANTTNYIYVDLGLAQVLSNTSGFTSSIFPVAVVVTGQSSVKSITDYRSDINSISGTSAPTNVSSQYGATVALPSLTPTPVTPIVSAGTGDIPLYTVPAGSRACYWLSIYNSSGSTITAYEELSKNGGSTYTRIGANGTINASGGYGFFAGLSFILEAGDVLGLNTSASGLNIYPSVMLFSNSAKVKQVFFTSFASGDNVVYTAPAGKTAVIWSRESGPVGGSAAGIYITNATGSSVNYTPKLTPSGGSTLTLGGASGVANGGWLDLNPLYGLNPYLNSGDAFVINSNSSTAGQACFFNVYEF